MRRCAPLLRLRACLVTCAVLTVSPVSSLARTFYIAPDGNDRYSGSKSAPWQTFKKAVKTLRPGDTVLIEDGTYPGGIRQNRPGLPGRPITYRAINPGKVILRGDVTKVREVFTVMEAPFVVVDGLTAVKGDRLGIWVTLSDNVIVRNCRALNSGVTGIMVSSSDDVLLEGNTSAYADEQHGIYVTNGNDRPVLRNNVCHNNGRCGIQLNGDGKNARPELGPSRDGIIEGAVVDGNVLFENGQNNVGAALNVLCVRSSVICNNLLFNTRAAGSRSLR